MSWLLSKGIHRRVSVGIPALLFTIVLTGCGNDPSESIIQTGQDSGYRSDSSDWSGFLDCWQEAALRQVADLTDTRLREEVQRRQSLRFPPADEKALTTLETRLGLALPPSYRDFLSASNGFVALNFDAEDALLFSTREIGPLTDLYPSVARERFGLSAADDAYFIYGPDQDPVHLRPEYLSDMIALSERVDAAILLLNPRVRTRDGEFEVWFYGWELPGAARFSSFADYMRQAYLLSVGDVDRMFPYSAQQLAGTCADRLRVDPATD